MKTHSWGRCIATSAALLAGAGTGTCLALVPSEADPVIARGLQHTAKGQKLVEQALDRANLLLVNTGYALSASWRATPIPAGRRAASVYLVASRKSDASTTSAVPKGCICVFVNPTLLEGWVKPHSTGSGRMALDTSYLLTFMLLHEVGHLLKGSSAVEFENGAMSQLNIEPSLAKASEEAADDFATGLIREYSRQSSASKASLEANWVAIELSKLSWNMQAYRTLDEFGASATGKPSVFFDQTYSHPNLAWRVLRSNDLIQQTPATKDLLDAFEKARRLGAENKPMDERGKQ